MNIPIQILSASAKKLILVFLILVFQSKVNSQSGWFVQPTGTNAFLNDVRMIDENTSFVCGFGGVVLKTSNGGTNWISSTITSADLYTIFFTDINTGYTAGSGMIFKTTNSGVNWTQLSSPVSSAINASFFINSNMGFVAGGSDNDGKIFRTTNGGDNWNEVGPGTVYPQILSVNFPSSNTGYVSGRNGIIMRSTNSGINWTILPSILGTADYFSIYFTSDNTGYAATPLGGKIIKTTNSGNNWYTVYDNSNYFPVIIFFSSPDTGYVTGGAVNNSVVLKTTNAGITWNDKLLGFTGHLNNVYFINNTTGTIAAEFGIMYKTTNGGIPVGIVQTSSLIPDKFLLHQNYPNPFNPVTKIKFDITQDVRRETQDVKLIVFDAVGKVVRTLVNEALTPGRYEADFDGSNFSSGIYFYKLQAGNFVETKRMVLLK